MSGHTEPRPIGRPCSLKVRPHRQCGTVGVIDGAIGAAANLNAASNTSSSAACKARRDSNAVVERGFEHRGHRDSQLERDCLDAGSTTSALFRAYVATPHLPAAAWTVN